MGFTKSEKIYLTAEFYNWDDGLGKLKKLLMDKDCDKATALLIYWRSSPDFYYEYASEKEIPSWSKDGYKLMKQVEKSILNDEFPELISYEPDEDRIPKDPAVLAKIPPKLLEPSKGPSDSTILANQYYYGTFLIEACDKGDIEKIKELLNKGFPILDVCIENTTPLHAALNKIKAFEYLLSNGADYTNTEDDSEMQLIHSAALEGKNTAIKALLSYGADVNTPTAKTGRTPLHVVLGTSANKHHWSTRKLGNTLKLLLKSGADLNIANAEGETALQVALNKNNKEALSIIESFNK